MLQKKFEDVYSKFRLHFYQNLFKKINTREATLTTVEAFSMEIIHYLGRPSVHEFAKIANISSPNAAYKVDRLIRKGYLKKVQSKEDKRKFFLEVTDKYNKYYNLSYAYVTDVMDRVYKRFTNSELATMEKVLKVMSEELMPEIENSTET